MIMFSKGYFETLVKRIKRRLCIHKYSDEYGEVTFGDGWPVYHKTCKKCGKWKYLD